MLTQYQQPNKRKRKLEDLVEVANNVTTVAKRLIDFSEGKIHLSPSEKNDSIVYLRNCSNGNSRFLTEKEKTLIKEIIEERQKELEDGASSISAEEIELKVEKVRAFYLKHLGTYTIAINSPQGLALEQIAKKLERQYDQAVSGVVRDFIKRNFSLITILSEEKLKDLCIELEKMFSHGKPSAESVLAIIKPHLVIGDLDIDEKLKMVNKRIEEETKLRLEAEQRTRELSELREKAERQTKEFARMLEEADLRAVAQTQLKIEEIKQMEELKRQIAQARQVSKPNH